MKKKLSIPAPVVYAIICAAVIIVVAVLQRLEIFNKLEYDSYDMRFRIRGVEEPADDIVIVAIDPQTLDFLGFTGVPTREYHVKLIENLYAAGAKAVMFDILFLVYTGRAIDEDTYSMDLGSAMSWRDSLLSDALFMYPNTVIARKQMVGMERATDASTGEPPLPIPELQYPGQLAFVDMVRDADDFVRRAQLVKHDFPPEMEWQYSFALKAAMYAMDADTAWVDTERHEAHVGGRIIPLDERNTMHINFRMDERTYARAGKYISYEQVLDDESDSGLKSLIEAGRLKDKVVLVGATYPDSKDFEATPFYLGTNLFSSSEIPMFGVHVHHNIASTIIQDVFITPLKFWQVVLLIALVAVLSTLINYKFRGFTGLVLSVLLIAVYGVAATVLFITNRLFIPVIAPSVVTVILNYTGVMTYNFLSERKQKALIKGAFGQYLNPRVVGELLNNPDMLTLGGEERVMTVIFSDVAGFTTISEKLTPTQLVELLNEYLTAMTDIILSYDGIIDKYEGDAIMAEFGAPLPDEQHAVKACLASIDMQLKLAEMRDQLRARGKDELYSRIGINSGTMVVGNMGSNTCFDYTVMGDNVNLSSRLEGANKAYNTAIMCSEATRKLVEDKVITRELDLLRVKGKTEGVLVHEVLGRKSDGLTDTMKNLIEIYMEGLGAYKERRWKDGTDLFSRALVLVPGDGPSTVYLERCTEYLKNPPPDDWDGIFVMRTK